MKKLRKAARFLVAVTLLASCERSSHKEAAPSLKEAFREDFYIGAALNYNQVYGTEAGASALIREQFNTITPENMLKMGPVHPEPTLYNFEAADKYVAFGLENNMFIVGHTLIWHSQAPEWIFTDDKGGTVSRDTLLERMQEHITTVMGRYSGNIDGWDVVNEALEDDGSLRKTKWLQIIGKDYLQKAFEFAAEADPGTQLYYNDYNLWKPEKRDGAIRLVRDLIEKGVPVDGIGMQAHLGIDYPSVEQLEESILAFAGLDVEVMITELDIDLLPNPGKRQGADIAETYEVHTGYNPYVSGLPDSMAQRLSNRYADLFALFHKHRDKISRVTFWGVSDQNSWLNNWPIEGRTSYPLLFNRNYQPKPAFQAVIKTASE